MRATLAAAAVVPLRNDAPVRRLDSHMPSLRGLRATESSLSQVVAALNGAISPTGQIDLYAASADPALTAIRPLLARFAITAAFPVAAASVSPAETSATLTGTANWGLPGAPVAKVRPVAVRLDCVAQGTAIVTFTLKLTMSQPDWTFDATFAGLPPTQMAQRGGVMPAASFLIGLRLNTAAFAAASDAAAGSGLTLTGSLPLANFWQPWKTLVGPWPLQLSGTVTVPASYDLPPLFDLLCDRDRIADRAFQSPTPSRRAGTR